MHQDLRSVKHVLLDIEGTICPISFVKDTLFPYALKALPNIVKLKWQDAEFEKFKSAFPNECQETTEKFIEHVKDLTERNIKVAYFKDLQGYLWEEGYKSGAYSSPFFEDVVPAVKQWKEAGMGISIYSSGSVYAQKLLFGHLNAHDPSDPKATIDLTPFVTDWFDTANAGSKMEPTSYVKICQALGLTSTQILFLSDNVKELEAAQEAKLQMRLVIREGNEEVSPEDKEAFGALETFEQLELGKEGEDHFAIPQNIKNRVEESNGNVAETREKTSGESADGKNARATENDEATAPPQKKQKSGYVKAKVERPPSQRRSRRLQKSGEEP